MKLKNKVNIIDLYIVSSFLKIQIIIINNVKIILNIIDNNFNNIVGTYFLSKMSIT